MLVAPSFDASRSSLINASSGKFLHAVLPLPIFGKQSATTCEFKQLPSSIEEGNWCADLISAS